MEMTRRAQDGWMELAIEGRLDGYWADHLDRGLTETVREGHHRLRLDLSRVTFLSSAGIGVIVKFYKRLTAIKGGLLIGNASPPVRTVLEITRLHNILIDSSPVAAAPETIAHARTLVRDGLAFLIYDVAPGARLTCRVLGSDQPLGAAAPECSTLRCTDTLFGIGIGAFGSSDADCRDRLGEFVTVAGAAAYMPADGTEVADYLLGSGERAPELQVLQAVACAGRPAHFARFEIGPPRVSVTLTDLASACLTLAGAAAAGVVVIAEVSGLVGAALRQSPAHAGAGDFFAFPDVRTRLTFTAERAFVHSLALVAGVVQQADGPIIAGRLRPLDARGELLGHFHAAAFPFHPFKKGRLDLRDTVAALFEVGGPLGVLHLLHDDRGVAGAGESEFTRGACWVGAIDAGQ